jgi:hypothetical protein
MKIYCSNEYCKGRAECKKAQSMQDGDKVITPVNGYYANRCSEFEAAKDKEGVKNGLIQNQRWRYAGCNLLPLLWRTVWRS